MISFARIVRVPHRIKVTKPGNQPTPAGLPQQQQQQQPITLLSSPLSNVQQQLPTVNSPASNVMPIPSGIIALAPVASAIPASSTQAALPTMSSQPLTITAKQLKGVVTSLPTSSFTTGAQSIRVVTGPSSSNAGLTNANTPIRLPSGQTVRLATSQTGAATILRGQTSIMTTPAIGGGGTTTTSATIGGKQILLQKPISLSGQNLLQLVKTSQGMTVVQKSGGQGGSNIGGAGQSAQIVTTGGQTKTALIGGNVVKLMTPAAVSGSKILMKNSNLMQVGKMTTNAAGKPAFVITNKQGQQIRTNQQIIFMTTAGGGIRTVQTGNNVTSANNFVSLVTTTSHINTLSSPAAGAGMSSAAATLQSATTGGGNTVKMIRGVGGGVVGKPITFTLPAGVSKTTGAGGQQIISMPQKGLTIGGKAVTVQLAPGAGGQKTVTILSSAPAASSKSLTTTSSGGTEIQQRIVMMPKRVVSTNIITHKTIANVQQISNMSNMNMVDDTGITDVTDMIDEEHIDQMDGADNQPGATSSDDDDFHQTVESRQHRGNRMSRGRLISRSKLLKTARIKPRYVRLGLFGGAPTPVASSSSTTSGANEGDLEDDSASGHPDDGSAADAVSSQDMAVTDATSESEHDEKNQSLSGLTGAATDDDYQNEQDDQQQLDAEDQQQHHQHLQQLHEQRHQSSGDRHEPTASETEAANILTIIKSGELLHTRPSDSPASTITSSAQDGGGNVTILFNNEPHTTNVTSPKHLTTGVVTASASVSSTIVTASPRQKTVYSSNTGHLDALASAALQASTTAAAAASTTTTGGLIHPKVEYTTEVSRQQQNAQPHVTTTQTAPIISSKQKGVVRHRRTTDSTSEEVIFHYKTYLLWWFWS